VASANVDFVRSLYVAWERGDFSSTEWAHPEIEYVLTGGGAADGTWTGLAGMAEGFRTFLSAWDEFRVEVEEFRELDGERVLVLTRLSGRGKTSGIDLGEMRAKGADILHIHDGKVTRFVLYSDRESGLADLDLAREAGAPGS
jgi:ketosteroid isomerase-like protein